ncbi:MAG TPA: succinate dehydrogenase, hydrophobic membrane anchor protein [Ignavibacteria bacterium]|jgi:succinate dehydrogenase / fumarate reductase membrane anchor subunit
MFKHQESRSTGSFSWVFQRVSGLILVVVMIGHYILMHYNPESGHTYDAVLARMQSNWYRVLDMVFVSLGMYHGLNGMWGIFRDYKLKSWQSITIISVLIIAGLAFTLWGIKTILDIPYVQTTTSELFIK